MSYSNEQIKFILEHYLEIASGNMPIDRAKEYLKSSGKKNPAEIFIIWKADIDRAISGLCPKNDLWCDLCREVTAEMLRFHARSLSQMQREIVMVHIMNEWPETPYCDGIITRMRKFLNGKFVNKKYIIQIPMMTRNDR